MASVEIVVGDRWKDDVLHLGSLRSRRPSNATPRLSEFRDVIDLVVFGENWTADIAEEHIFPFFSDLVGALSSLANGDSAKEILEFPAAPYELTMIADGEQIQLTLMSIDRERDVLAFDVAVQATEFIHAACRAGERLLVDLLSLDDLYAADPFVRHFSAALASLARRRKISLPMIRRTEDIEIAGATSRTDASVDLTLSYEVSLTAGFMNYTGAPVFDWHALLLPGQLLVESQGRHTTLGGRFPVLTLHSILRRVREVLNHEEAGRAVFSCKGRLPGIFLDIEVDHGVATVNLGAEPPLQVKTHVRHIVDLLLSLARLILDDVHRQNGAIIRNHRFDELDAQTRELQAWYEDTHAENKYFERPEQYLDSHAGLRPTPSHRESPTFQWPLKDVRAVYPSLKWEWSNDTLYFSAVTVVDEHVLVPAVDGLHCLRIEDGTQAWFVSEFDGIKLASFAVAGPYVVVANERGNSALLSCDTGALVTQNETGSPMLTGAAHYPDHGLVVVADYRGNLSGIRLDGSTGWQRVKGQGTLVGAAFAGPLVATLSHPGVLSGYDPLTGESLWRVRLGAAGQVGPLAHEGRIYGITHDEITDHCTLHCIHPFTGRAAWRLPIDGIPLSTPTCHAGRMILTLEAAGQVSVVILDLRTAEVVGAEPVMSAGLDRPTDPLLVEIAGQPHVVIRTDRAEMTCLKLADASPLWRYRPEALQDSLLVRNLPVYLVRDSLLCAAERLVFHDLASGEVLHEFSDVFEAPEYLYATGALQMLVGESGDVGQPDSLSCFSIEHFLALVT